MEVGYMSWYTKEEIEKLLEDEELRKRIARFVTMSGEEFFDEVYTHLSPAKNFREYYSMLKDGLSDDKPSFFGFFFKIIFVLHLYCMTHTLHTVIKMIL